MNIATVFHNKAMEFADEAILAGMSGNSETSKVLFEKAFSLEKEAADKVSINKQDAKAILISSAASLALKCDKTEEARLLIEQILPNFDNLSKDVQSKVKATQQNINNATKYTESSSPSVIKVIGLLTSADAQKQLIEIRDEKADITYSISVPAHLINELVKKHWAKTVHIEGLRTTSGGIVFEKLIQAA